MSATRRVNWEELPERVQDAIADLKYAAFCSMPGVTEITLAITGVDVDLSPDKPTIEVKS